MFQSFWRNRIWISGLLTVMLGVSLAWIYLPDPSMDNSTQNIWGDSIKFGFLRDCIVGFASIVVGVPFALYLSHLGETKKEREENRAILEALKRSFRKNLDLLDEVVRGFGSLEQIPTFRLDLNTLVATQTSRMNVIKDEEILADIETAHYECFHVDTRLSAIMPKLGVVRSQMIDQLVAGSLALAGGDNATQILKSEKKPNAGAVGHVCIAIGHIYKLLDEPLPPELANRVEEASKIRKGIFLLPNTST